MKGCGHSCRCDDICPRAEAMVDDYDTDLDGAMADLESDRYQRWIEGDA